MKGLVMMVVKVWMMMMMVPIIFIRFLFSWPLNLLEQLWVQFVFVFLKYEMETVDPKYVIPFEYYKVRPFDMS